MCQTNDSQLVHTKHCFNSFYPEYFADNQIGKIIENDIFLRFDILSFIRYIIFRYIIISFITI